MEHYGDVHLHQADYPSTVQPGQCDSSYNYYHGNQCTGGTGGMKNGHPYDCHCGLCQSPYSTAYEVTPGGHLGGLRGIKPCGFPYCKCTDCSGSCKCTVQAQLKREYFEGSMGTMDMKMICLGVGLGLIVLWLLRKRFRN